MTTEWSDDNVELNKMHVSNSSQMANNTAKEHWALNQQRLNNIWQQEEEEQRQQLLHEEEAAQLEEREKTRTTAYAIRKLKVGHFCDLHYFTNKGLDDAKAAVLVVEPDTLVLLPEANSIHAWVPAAAVKDPKALAIIKDENLTWEEFNEAALHMITMMKTQDWPDNQVLMHIQFCELSYSTKHNNVADGISQ
ncbi:uncharacterized protein F5147DRAFT_773523 [Suillus discolor]|uniref:Uncharacterized protein n=1 Tax=Suillus discolor TaxID=1912936 RepID=A0A9P7F8Z1_9AGAM|nr:uncharacterized protein F5147DRAFT_773523 [Suillus discolor]KAG2108724.1 hypothetical protein F5147DRAFT_773523 [Suillus discolor]